MTTHNPFIVAMPRAQNDRNDVLQHGTLVLLFPRGMGVVVDWVGLQGSPDQEHSVYIIYTPQRQNMQEDLRIQMSAAARQFESYQNPHLFSRMRRGLDFVELRPGQGFTIDMSAMQLANGYDFGPHYELPEWISASHPPAYTAKQSNLHGNYNQMIVVTVITAPQTFANVLSDVFGFEVEMQQNDGVDRITLLPPCFQDLMWYGPPSIYLHERVRVYRRNGRQMQHGELRVLENFVDRDFMYSPEALALRSMRQNITRELPERNGDYGTVVLGLRRWSVDPYVRGEGSCYWVHMDDGTLEAVRRNEAIPIANEAGVESNSLDEDEEAGVDPEAHLDPTQLPVAFDPEAHLDPAQLPVAFTDPKQKEGVYECNEDGEFRRLTQHYSSMNRTCDICTLDKPLIVLTPCGHRIVCQACWNTYSEREQRNGQRPRCPKCRTLVRDSILPINALLSTVCGPTQGRLNPVDLTVDQVNHHMGPLVHLSVGWGDSFDTYVLCVRMHPGMRLDWCGRRGLGQTEPFDADELTGWLIDNNLEPVIDPHSVLSGLRLHQTQVLVKKEGNVWVVQKEECEGAVKLELPDDELTSHLR